jgi:hypothetical protein
MVGLALFFVQHLVERRDSKRAEESEALREFAEALMPLLIELDRWRYNPDQSVVWVGSSRQLPALRTWIIDPEENARKAPDWLAIGRHAQEVERLWRDRLSQRASAPAIDAEWSEVSKLLFHIASGGAGPRTAAEQAETEIIGMLEAIEMRATLGSS